MARESLGSFRKSTFRQKGYSMAAVIPNTPGVYIQEIPKLPPSVAPVATAIPAFIGYTEIAKEVEAGDLKFKPKRITSLVDYQQYFGGAQKEESITVKITKSADGAIT